MNGPRSVMRHQRRVRGLYIRHAHDRTQRQRAVRGGHGVHVIDFAVRSAAVVVRRSIPTGEPGFGCDRAAPAGIEGSARSARRCRRFHRLHSAWLEVLAGTDGDDVGGEDDGLPALAMLPTRRRRRRHIHPRLLGMSAGGEQQKRDQENQSHRQRVRRGSYLARGPWVLFHVVGEGGELLRGHAQGLGRMRAHRGHDLVVQILDEFRDLLFQTFGGLVDGLANARDASSTLRLKSFMVLLEMRREPTHANVADARHVHYFVVGRPGQSREADFAGSSQSLTQEGLEGRQRGRSRCDLLREPASCESPLAARIQSLI